MPIPIQSIRTSELDKRFNIGKNTRVNRLAMLGLTPDRLIKEGRYYLLNKDQLDLFTDFDKYILETGSCDGYPKLLANYSDRSKSNPPISSTNDIFAQAMDLDGGDEAGQLAKAIAQDLDDLMACGLPSALGRSDIFTSFTGEFTGTLPTYQADDDLALHVAENAQRRATAILLAEHTLAEQYINNPHLLNPDLRSQLDAIQFSKIDPKGLAASLVATAQRHMTAA
jgi:hypothetical protein